ncbi:hypothetical protein, partial [Thiolapillus sp.]|uniref:hypothetical protein n=1 Tax=Thiolapillus sp. TaxID=2017437 RepID=UPI003AF6E5B8
RWDSGDYATVQAELVNVSENEITVNSSETLRHSSFTSARLTKDFTKYALKFVRQGFCTSND